jgi:hypothetical protein
LGTIVIIDSIPAVDGSLTYILAAVGVTDVPVYSSTAAVDPAVAVLALLVSLLLHVSLAFLLLLVSPQWLASLL